MSFSWEFFPRNAFLLKEGFDIFSTKWDNKNW